MNTQGGKNSPANSVGHNRPTWEPYVFTAGVLTAFIVFLFACGYVGRIPFVEHILFALMTIAPLFRPFDGSSKPSLLTGSILLSALFGLAGLAYFQESQLLLGIEYSILSLNWEA